MLVFLSLLIDLCEYEETVTYLVTWRSNKNSENLLTILCQLWRQEEKTLGVKRTLDGCISGEVFSFMNFCIQQKHCRIPLYGYVYMCVHASVCVP